MKSLSLRLSVLVVSLACIEQTSDCDDGMLMPEDWNGSGYSDLLTPALSTEQRPMPTPSLSVPPQTLSTEQRPMPPTPSLSVPPQTLSTEERPTPTPSLSVPPQTLLTEQRPTPTPSLSLPPQTLLTEQRSTPTPSLSVPPQTLSTETPTPSLSQTMTIPMTTTPLPPSDQPTLLSFLTSTIFIAAVACGAAVLMCMMVCLVVVCKKSKRMKNCRYWCWCPCSKRFAKPQGPFITVSFRNSYRGDRESYFIKTDDVGPTTLYTRPGEDDANMEFTAAMFYTPSTEGQVNNLQNVAFNYPKREYQAPGWQPEMNREEAGTERDGVGEITEDFHIQELDVLERVLDNALVKFETTTL